MAVLICKDFLISDRDEELLISLPTLNAKQIYPNLVYFADTKSGFNRTPEKLVTSFAFFLNILHLQSDHKKNPFPTSLSSTSRKLQGGAKLLQALQMTPKCISHFLQM